MRLALIMLLTVGAGMSTPALALRCHCIAGYITSSGTAVCTAWNECPMLRGARPPREMRSDDDCPATRAIFCPPRGKCRLVCGEDAATKATR